MEEVLPHLGECAIKSTYPAEASHTAFQAVLGSQLGRRELDEWASRIVRRGDEHTVQSYLPLSRMPTASELRAGRIAPRAMLLRAFAVSDGELLARAAGRTGAPRRSQRADRLDAARRQQRRRLGADARRGRPHDAAAAACHAAIAGPAPAPVTSRAAENMHWLGRYTEQADNAVRLARLTLDLLGGEDPAFRRCWPGCISWRCATAWCRARLERRHGLERCLAGHAFATGVRARADRGAGQRRNRVPASASACSASARPRPPCASGCRPTTGARSCMRRRISRAAAPTRPVNSAKAVHRRHRALEAASTALSAVTGAQTDRMTRDDAWRLLSIGRHIERLAFLSSALAAGFEHGSVHEVSGFEAMVSLFDEHDHLPCALPAAARRVATMVDMLVLDGDSPRSLAWVTQTLRGRIARLAGSAPGKLTALSYELPDLATSTLENLCAAGPDGHYGALEQLFEACETAAYHVSDAIGTRYFTLTSESVRSVGA